MKTEVSGISKASSYVAGFLIVAAVYVLLFFEQTEWIGTLLLGAIAMPVVYLLLFNKSVLLQLIVFTVPLSVRIATPFFGAAFSAPGEILLAALVIVSIPILLFSNRVDRKILMHPLTLFLIVDTAWLFFTCLTSEMPEVSLKRLLMRILFITGYYFIFAHLFQNKKILTRPHLLYALGLIPAVFYIWKAHAHYNFDSRAAFSISQPFFPDHTVYGASIAFLIPTLFILLYNHKIFFPKKIHRNMMIVVLVIICLAEFLAFSRAAIISLAVALILYWSIRFFRIKLWQLVSLLCVLVIAVLVNSTALVDWARRNDAVSNDGDLTNHYKSVTNITRDASNLERINRWTCAYRMFEDRPIVGYGPGTYQFVYAKYQTKETTTYISTQNGDRGNAHSEYMTYLSECGWPGLASYLCLSLYTLYMGLSLYYKRKDRRTRALILTALLGLITFYFHGLFNAFIDQDKMAALVFPAMAMLVAIDIYHKDPQRENENVSA